MNIFQKFGDSEEILSEFGNVEQHCNVRFAPLLFSATCERAKNGNAVVGGEEQRILPRRCAG